MPVVITSKSRKTAKKLQKDQELIETSLKRFKVTAEAEAASRKQGLEDLKFSIGTGQWDEGIKADREIQGKPCLTVNRIPTFLRQFTGEERQHRPAMIVDPVGSGADEEVAEIFQGILRHVEVASTADVTYDNSYDMMLRIGWSNWRIVTDYVDEESFDQEPRIELIENPFAVYSSPIRKPDGTDPLWVHVIADLSREEYEEKYPKSQMTAMRFPSEAGNAPPDWVVKDGVRIAEYWWLELEKRVLCLLEDGTTCFQEELGSRAVIDKRDTVTRTVKCVKHNAIEVLEMSEYPGRYIPIIELSGVRLNVNGMIYKSGVVRDARDAQRIYDFMVTREVEQIDLYGKDPLFVAEGSITNHEEEYRQLNRKNFPYLYYKALNDDGKQLPAPNRASREPPIQAMAAIVQQADYDMKAVIGIYGNGPGEQAQPNESAFAVLTRAQQTDTGTVNWSDNLNRAITWQGRILVDLCPKLLDRPRIQRIINPDDSTKRAVVFNSQMSEQPDAEQMAQAAALEKVYDLGVGKYDVTLSSGPQYRTARQEAFRALGAIITARPEIFPIVGDVWLKYGDFPGAHVLVDRLKKMLPPNLQDQDDADPTAQIAQKDAALQAMQMQNSQLVAELARASDDIRTKRLDLDSKERIALFNNLTQLTMQQLKGHDAAALAHLQEMLGAITQRLSLAGAQETIQQEAGAAPPTPELPGKVEPKVQPVTPAAPVAPVPGSTG